MSTSRSGVVLAVLLLGAMAFAPLVEADHVYSHRYVITGRVVDAEGKPVSGVQVNLTLVRFGSREEGPCPQEGAVAGRRVRVDEQTGENHYVQFTRADGTYFVCSHMHTMTNKQAEVKVEVLGVSKSEVANLDQRRTQINLQLPGTGYPTNPAEVEKFETSYVVTGIVWKPWPRQGLEGVSVNGEAQKDANVTVELTYNDGKTATGNAFTNGYGAYGVVLQLAEPLESGSVKIASPGAATVSRPADTTFHITEANLVQPADAGGGIDLVTVGGALLILGAVAFGGWYLYRGMAEKRALAQARETTTRRRANK
ncbi:MAG TPA: hypothetical protein VM889_12825 [Candidatus Thermoplasmatota archaeon]|nr:hypothetical protein [Candidatus Thermoplasmatota archaeon]